MSEPAKPYKKDLERKGLAYLSDGNRAVKYLGITLAPEMLAFIFRHADCPGVLLGSPHNKDGVANMTCEHCGEGIEVRRSFKASEAIPGTATKGNE